MKFEPVARAILQDLQKTPELSTSTGIFATRLSINPLVALGFDANADLPLTLIFPPGVLPADLEYERLSARSNTLLQAKFGTGSLETITAGYMKFDRISPAVELILDALVSSLVAGADDAGQLAWDFVELFSPSVGLSHAELLGMYGELKVIDLSPDIELMATGWHQNLDDRYDFAWSGKRLEVKTSSGKSRMHTFSSNQLPPPVETHLEVASLVTETLQSGETVIDVFRSVYERIQAKQVRERFRKVFFQFATKDPLACELVGFDSAMASKSLRFYEGEDIPFLCAKYPITAATWTVDVTSLQDFRTIY